MPSEYIKSCRPPFCMHKSKGSNKLPLQNLLFSFCLARNACSNQAAEANCSVFTALWQAVEG